MGLKEFVGVELEGAESEGDTEIFEGVIVEEVYGED